MYIALRDFEVNGQKFLLGETVPDELIEPRLLKVRKVGEVSEVAELITEVVETNVEEILLEDSSAVEVKIEEVSEVAEVIPVVEPIKLTKDTKKTKK